MTPTALGLPLTLGGGEVRLLELAGAYAAFATGGHRVEPVTITRVEAERTGRVLKARRRHRVRAYWMSASPT